MTVRDASLVMTECDYSAVDVANNSTTVYNGPCLYYGAAVTTALSAHALPIMDGSATVDSFAASSAVGVVHSWPGIRCNTSLIVDPNDAATGNITVFYRPLNFTSP
jgi:hypothetical protein